MASDPGPEPRPKHPPQNSFVLMVTGQIEKAEVIYRNTLENSCQLQFISVTNTYCKYCFVYGSDWKQVGGLDQGRGKKKNLTRVIINLEFFFIKMFINLEI